MNLSVNLSITQRNSPQGAQQALQEGGRESNAVFRRTFPSD